MEAQTVSQEIQELVDLARPEVIDVLAKAAEDDDVWMKAARTSRVFSRKAASKSLRTPRSSLSKSSFVAARVNVPWTNSAGRPDDLYEVDPALYRKPHVNPLPSLKLCVKWEDTPSVCVRPEDLLRRY